MTRSMHTMPMHFLQQNSAHCCHCWALLRWPMRWPGGCGPLLPNVLAMPSPLLLPAAPMLRTAASQLHGEPPCCSGRGLVVPCWPTAQRALKWARQQPPRRLVVRSAEFQRDPRGGGSFGGGSGGGNGGVGSGGPATYQQQQQQPWGAESYQYPPQPSAAPPPRLPPNGGNGSGPEGGGSGGPSNLTRAFIAGAFILGAWADEWSGTGAGCDLWALAS